MHKTTWPNGWAFNRILCSIRWEAICLFCRGVSEHLPAPLLCLTALWGWELGFNWGLGRRWMLPCSCALPLSCVGWVLGQCQAGPIWLASPVQAHCGLRTHHSGECFQLPEGLPAQGPGRCQCGDRLSSQVRGPCCFKTLHATRHPEKDSLSVHRSGGEGAMLGGVQSWIGHDPPPTSGLLREDTMELMEREPTH